MPLQQLRVLERLGRDLRAYMTLLGVAKTIGVDMESQRHYRGIGGDLFVAMCSSIWFMLERHLRRQQGTEFPDDGWVDGFSIEQLRICGPDEIYLGGLFDWVQGQELWWLDPGTISLRFLPGTEVVAHYGLRFGDATTGLAKRPYARHRPPNSIMPSNWLFEFDGPRHSGLNA